VIFLEFVTGVILMDALGFTKLIPAFEGMSDKGKKWLAFIAFGFLAAFSVLEMTLSIVREQIIEQQQETRDLANAALVAPALSGNTPAAAPDTAVPAEDGAAAQPSARDNGLQMATIAQLILAAIIPWLLAAAALPLETIIRNSVFMVSIATSYVLLALGFIFSSIGAPSQTIGRLFGGSGDRSEREAAKAEEREARKQAKKDKKKDAGDARNRQEDDLMVFEELPQEEPQHNRRDKRQRELQRA
jgi:hypothetical protein